MDSPLEPGTPAANWFYVLRGQRQGPLEEASLAHLISVGQIRAETLVWTEGMPEWLAAGSVPRWASELQNALAAGLGGAPPVAPGPIMSPGRAYVQAGYAGFWLRFLACMLDGIITYIAFNALRMAVIMPLGLLGATSGSSGSGASGVAFVAAFFGETLLEVVLGWLYFALMESSRHQGTLGKMALGIRVTTMEGARVSFARATGRYFAKILSALILLVGYIMAGFTQRKQGLHDMIADTLVVRGRA